MTKKKATKHNGQDTRPNTINGVEIAQKGSGDRLLQTALDAFLKGEKPTHPDEGANLGAVILDPLPEIRAMPKPPACLLYLNESRVILCVRWTSRRTPANESNWLVATALELKHLGSTSAWVPATYNESLTQDQVASLQSCIGESSDLGAPTVRCELAEVEAACIFVNPKNRSWRPMIRCFGEWFGFTPPIPRTHAYAQTQSSKDADRRRRQGYPDIAIV